MFKLTLFRSLAIILFFFFSLTGCFPKNLSNSNINLGPSDLGINNGRSWVNPDDNNPSIRTRVIPPKQTNDFFLCLLPESKKVLVVKSREACGVLIKKKIKEISQAILIRNSQRSREAQLRRLEGLSDPYFESPYCRALLRSELLWNWVNTPSCCATNPIHCRAIQESLKRIGKR
ncbi:hypothetical protein KKC45_03590 [Patescibacteria group bacterium]|nr:hypothetical protein [Patescibacteria group bacterium]